MASMAGAAAARAYQSHSPRFPTTVPDPDDPTATITVDGDPACGNGGGLYCLDSDALIQNTYIMENTASGVGGGAYLANGMPMLKNCLVSSNSADRKSVV